MQCNFIHIVPCRNYEDPSARGNESLRLPTRFTDELAEFIDQLARVLQNELLSYFRERRARRVRVKNVNERATRLGRHF